MLTVLEIIKRTTDFFATKGVENPRLNAELIVGHELGLKRMQLYLQFERPLTEAELEKIRPLVRRRAQREPLQYVLGETEFCGLKLKVDRRALIPRPETELLVELVGQRVVTSPARVLDLGTGSGALALVLAQRYPEAQVVGVDRQAEALALAAENANACGLEGRVSWIESSWFEALPTGETFALMVANPPYLTAEETAQTAPEVRAHEPVSALTAGGADGADDLRAILSGAPRWLAAGGLIALETGIAQHAALREFAAAQGLEAIESLPDLSGRDRFLIARRPAAIAS